MKRTVLLIAALVLLNVSTWASRKDIIKKEKGLITFTVDRDLTEPNGAMDKMTNASAIISRILRNSQPVTLIFYTSKEWTAACAAYSDMKVSMDGRGRAKDNIWIERFWKTIKYENEIIIFISGAYAKVYNRFVHRITCLICGM